MTIFLLSDEILFPDPRFARKDGLLAVGGDLSSKRLILAYKNGIFPWFSDDEPILWWSPDPRFILYPDKIHISESLKKIIKKKFFSVTFDTAFNEVIKACRFVRINNEERTWITKDMIYAYTKLHQLGFAHSVETWHNDKLAGGLYRVSLGKYFAGESMFTYISNASKVAFFYLAQYCEKNCFDMIDCQVKNNHIKNFGAKDVPRDIFLEMLSQSVLKKTIRGKWEL